MGIWWTLDASSSLTTRAIKSAAGRLHATSDESTAPQARLAGTVINLEAFGIRIRSFTRPAEVKQTITPSAAIVVQWHCAAASDGSNEHATDGAAKALYLLRCELAGRQCWREPSTKKRLAGINVPEAGHHSL